MMYRVFVETDKLISDRGATCQALLAAIIGLCGIAIAIFAMIAQFKASQQRKKEGCKPRKTATSTSRSFPKMPYSLLCGGSKTTSTKLSECFPGALTNQELVGFIKRALKPFGFGSTSLVATSLCCDEVNRPLEKELAGIYNSYFAMGGLAGVPFGGVTAFGAMAHHIPDNGSCLLVYGPHVGVDTHGNVGTVNRRGKLKGGACCRSAVAASGYVKGVLQYGKKKADIPEDPFDAQQTFVGNLLLPHGKRLQHALDAMVELPFALYDVQTGLIDRIVTEGSGNVAGDGKIAVLGGIQINTPKGMSDYFLPIRFDVFDNKGAIIEKNIPARITEAKIHSCFSGALSNADFVKKVSSSLAPYGYGKSSLLCTSLCCDEVNRTLEHDLDKLFGAHFNIGGLGGFAFGGATGFGAMAHHIPDSGSCLVVYGPHVGVDSSGHVGTVDRRGRHKGGACCRSGVAACKYVKEAMRTGKKTPMKIDLVDGQQAYVTNMLLPYGDELRRCDDTMVALPHAMFKAQDNLMLKIVSSCCRAVAEGGKIALVGGIQINTPEGTSDYFLPLRFEVLTNHGTIVDDLLKPKH